MTDSRLLKAADFLKTHQNPDGGWGYRPGGSSFVEPTGLAALAVHSCGFGGEASRALAFLKSCQKSDGAVGSGPRHPEGNWMAYAALLAFHALGAAEEERRLKGWILGLEDASERFSKAEIANVASLYRYDASIPGWPWTPRTTAWVEPTALFMIGLLRAGVSARDRRVRSGVALLLDRRVPSGGWNFGNPYSKSHELEATTMSTALALAALGAAGVPEGRPGVGEGIRFLASSLEGDVGTAALAWTLLALRSYPAGAPHVPKTANRLAALQTGLSGFRDNPFETALAFLVLSEASILKPAAAERP